MKDSKDNIVGSYPAWMDFIEKNNGDAFTQAVIKLDSMLKAEFSYYVPGSFYNQMLIIFPKHLVGKKYSVVLSRAIELTIFQSLKAVIGEFNSLPKYINTNIELSNTIKEVQTIMNNVGMMVQAQDCFDKLNRLPINKN
jgi:hypothetical protein